MTKQKQAEKISFELTANHTHGGKQCVPGDVITLRPDQVERLTKEGKGKAVSSVQGNTDVI